MNAEIEHASPHGKAPGEKVPGQRKKIGAAAAREYEERQRRQQERPAGERPRAFLPTPASEPSVVRYGPGLLALFLARWFRRLRS